MVFSGKCLAAPLDPSNTSNVRAFQRHGSDDFFMLQKPHLVGGESQHFFQDPVVVLAEAGRRAVGVWGQGGVLDFNVVEPAERADTVTTVLMNDGRDPKPLLEYCDKKCGVVLGIGIGDLSGKAVRIAHMGHVNAPMILGTLGALEIGLVALGIPHGKGGVQAAIDWLGQSVSV